MRNVKNSYILSCRVLDRLSCLVLVCASLSGIVRFRPDFSSSYCPCVNKRNVQTSLLPPNCFLSSICFSFCLCLSFLMCIDYSSVRPPADLRDQFRLLFICYLMKRAYAAKGSRSAEIKMTTFEILHRPEYHGHGLT